MLVFYQVVGREFTYSFDTIVSENKDSVRFDMNLRFIM